MLGRNRCGFFSLEIAAALGITALVLSGCNGSQSSPPVKTLTSIEITPANPSVAAGSTQQFAASGTFSDGSTSDVTTSVGWSSSDTGLATINGSGLAMAAAIGRPQIIATSGAISSSTRLIIVGAATLTVARFAYVAGNVDGTISAFTANPGTGQLRHNGYSFAGQQPLALTVEPRGKFTYAANSGDNTISEFSIDPASGELTALTGSPTATENAPLSLVVDPSGSFAYVANSGSGNVSAFTIDPGSGALAAIAGSPFAAGTNPSSIAVDSLGKFVYVANPTSNNVSGYKIDPTSGALTAAPGSPFTAGSSPSAVTVDPTGHFAYVANSVSTDVSVLSIDPASSGLSSIPGSPFSTGAGMEITGVTVDPTGKFLYVANFGSSSVSVFSINTGGGLTPVSGSPFSASSSPRSVQIEPAGKFAYVPTMASNEVEVFSIGTTGVLTAVGRVRTRPQAAAMAFSVGSVAVSYTPKFAYATNLTSNNVSAFAIDPVSGGLTAVPGSPFAAGSGPFGVTTDPAGKFVYVTNGASNSVSAYTVNAGTGALTQVSGSPFTVGFGVQLGTPAVEPSGRFLYVPAYDSNLVFAYQINATSGALAPITSSPFPALQEPVSIAVDPSGRFVYVANQGAPLTAYSMDVPPRVDSLTSQIKPPIPPLSLGLTLSPAH
jgi:6-phosphogluconolactonase (cycloisomerase 2 family)